MDRARGVGASGRGCAAERGVGHFGLLLLGPRLWLLLAWRLPGAYAAAPLAPRLPLALALPLRRGVARRV
jgi:hypothetical protein